MFHLMAIDTVKKIYLISITYTNILIYIEPIYAHLVKRPHYTLVGFLLFVFFTIDQWQTIGNINSLEFSIEYQLKKFLKIICKEKN